ncbi:MAG: hypothetical protein QOH65_1828, partial [Methylobacteriaceae bacterium]|nr:hypothetical protein [Methylobacteriaceae bacterium]
WVDDIDRGANLFDRDVSFEIVCKADAELGFEAGVDQFARGKDMAAGHDFENAAKDRLVKTELLLNGFRREPNLPANMSLTRSDAAIDQCELDAIGIIKRQPVEIGLRKKLTARAGGPEILEGTGEIGCHRVARPFASITVIASSSIVRRVGQAWPPRFMLAPGTFGVNDESQAASSRRKAQETLAFQPHL